MNVKPHMYENEDGAKGVPTAVESAEEICLKCTFAIAETRGRSKSQPKRNGAGDWTEVINGEGHGIVSYRMTSLRK